jgi:hypothetical protein
MQLSITGKIHTAPEDPPLPPGRYVYQRTAPGLGNITTDQTGRSQVRAHVFPANPRTAAQLAHRGRIAAAVRAWHALSPEQQKQYQPAAAKQGLSAYHVFIAEYVRTHAVTSFSPWRSLWDGDKSGWDTGKTDWRSSWDNGETLFDL